MIQAGTTARRRLGWVAAAATTALLVLLVSAAGAQARSKFDIRLLAHVGSPGYPALSLVAPDRTIYVSTFTNAQGSDTGPSKVFAYSPDGRLERTYTITGQTPGAAHGVQVAARDQNGLLYLLDQNPSRVLVLDPATGAQQTYATFHDVPPCTTATPGTECSDTVQDNPPEPDYAAWGTDGSLYVTDYQQGLIWRVPPGGGAAHVWFTSPHLDGALFGPAGIVLMPDHRTLMLDTSAGGVTDTGDPTTGKLYTLPILPSGAPGSLHKLWESGPREGPDGFALAASGNVFMALVGPGANQLVELSPSGHELARAPSTIQNNQMAVPFDEPSSVSFDGDRMIVTNDAYFDGNQAHFAIFDVFAGESGAPVYVPPASLTPGAQLPRGTSLASSARIIWRLKVTPRKVRAGHRRRLRFQALERINGRWVPLRRALVFFDGRRLHTNANGIVTVRIRFRHSGRYVAWLVQGKSVLAHAAVRAMPRRR